jgi:hypothetical protein
MTKTKYHCINFIIKWADCSILTNANVYILIKVHGLQIPFFTTKNHLVLIFILEKTNLESVFSFLFFFVFFGHCMMMNIDFILQLE